MTHFSFKRSRYFPNRTKILDKIDFQNFIIYGSFITILIIATISMAIADESFLVQSSSNSEFGQVSALTPRGHIEDFSWTKRVSAEGLIEISGIGFSIVNDDKMKHSFEICSIIQGPSNIFTPSLDSPLACTTSKEIEGNEKISNLYIDFPNGIKVSDLIDISITIQEG